MNFSTDLLYLLVGLLAGLIGTLVGAGGGFIIVPALMTLWPGASPEELTATSLLVVFFNGLSATLAQAYRYRGKAATHLAGVDWRMGWRYALAAVPGSLLGANLLKGVSTASFMGFFGLFLMAMGAVLFKKSRRPYVPPRVQDPALEASDLVQKGRRRREWLATFFSGVVSFAASALGIGGGIFYVPALIYWLKYPIHRATATSQFVMTLMSMVAISVHVVGGVYENLPMGQVLLLVASAIIGAQIGARIGHRVKESAIVAGLALLLVTMGVRLFLRAFVS